MLVLFLAPSCWEYLLIAAFFAHLGTKYGPSFVDKVCLALDCTCIPVMSWLKLCSYVNTLCRHRHGLLWGSPEALNGMIENLACSRKIVGQKEHVNIAYPQYLSLTELYSDVNFSLYSMLCCKDILIENESMPVVH